ncbi:MAG: isoprenylcysteine carboxylmethyltransferase family protein [Candidatus Bathyarchaeia archaeon]
MDAKIAVFAATILSELILGGSLILTLLYPKHRVWPPPRKNSWQYWYTHILTEASITGVLVLGVLDWNSFVLTHESRFVLASLLVAVGSVLFVWALRTLSINTSLGLGGGLTTRGPYKYSRNPQYVGAMLFFVGFMIAFNSLFAYITGTVGIGLFILASFTEEPWLRDKYRQYDEYCKKVPRFFEL